MAYYFWKAAPVNLLILGSIQHKEMYARSHISFDPNNSSPDIIEAYCHKLAGFFAAMSTTLPAA